MSGAVFYIFGATGDLAKRKLFPAFYSLYREGKLGENFAVVGLARRSRTNEQFRDDVKHSIEDFARYKVTDEAEWERFAQRFEYMSLDINNVAGFHELNVLTAKLDEKYQTGGNRLFYLALAPELFGNVSYNLSEGGLLKTKGWHRLVIEKPFGYDLPSAERLNGQLRQVFEEQDIYRIDHYLGKEMVQNIEFVRFANAFFEPLWNNKYIANIQITLSETVGVEERGGYYDHSGALRDMGQNHMLQMLMMMAMEPPSRLHPEDIRDEKVKVLRSLRLFESGDDVRANVVRGQYSNGSSKGKALPAYREEDSVSPQSTTETYFAARVHVDNFRWAGVPFYIRTGKRLPVKTTEVVVEFKNIPNNVYLAKKHELEPNLLVFRVNPMEGIYLKMNAKQPGSEGVIVPVAMDFCQSCQIGINTPEAYERLLYDATRGDSTYFTRWDEVALAWSYVDRIAAAWSESSEDLKHYPAGSWGPEEAAKLLSDDGFKWWPINGQNEGEVDWEAVQKTTVLT
ncbi:glucose-6-phosphate dehydrogenase [Paenibacillus alginolyticus]|uniref:Glucose-6-phosphate 1-dehydrogenase n=1 Tax=Paenibacillus alginolyticus TaxID=59839 RepID=A0ABT4G6F0_9BACL|nr:glucose-6-phosphate dehydrogenase [Paenibacillus alginolyticus]MCY9668849.1 glucose-6-phosphate dehydrogenase [Paenibacillus alginolyticus]MCY9691761.1 glucose-6-phosphate dehydrogenase [Paenibacillus alginolyticus]MEC0143273.1 glucose-6-phosphate dehydrogenase [Paenibacillus alginolyticus]